LQAYKAVFTSPSSAKDVEGNGNGADVISNNRRAKKSISGIKVKKHVAQIIHMDKVTPHSIAYIACQVSYNTWSDLWWRFTLTLAGAICTLFCYFKVVHGWWLQLLTILAKHHGLLQKGPWSRGESQDRKTTWVVD
jgi:hypothetical protein